MSKPWVSDLAELTVLHKLGTQLSRHQRRRLRRLTSKMVANTGRGELAWRQPGYQKRRFTEPGPEQAPPAISLLPAPFPSLEYDLARFRPRVIVGHCPFTGMELVLGTPSRAAVVDRQTALGAEILRRVHKKTAAGRYHEDVPQYPTPETCRLVGVEVEKCMADAAGMQVRGELEAASRKAAEREGDLET